MQRHQLSEIDRHRAVGMFQAAEHTWDIFGKSLIAYQPRAHTVRKFRQLFPELWDALNQNHLDDLIRIMPRRYKLS